MTIDAGILTLFATASVEMWHRSVHSFLISVSLTETSPLWASVSGYYSSHYSVRAFAHLLGYFQSYRLHKTFQVVLSGGQYKCMPKETRLGEHQFYWKTVKGHAWFANDSFFTNNDTKNKKGPLRYSDSGHRGIANYADHVNGFPDLQVLNENVLKQRILKLSKIELSGAPIPNVEKYPDTQTVQLIAYHRMVKFRNYVDKVLEGSNAFWTTHRNPLWVKDFMDFHIIEPNFEERLRNEEQLREGHL